MRVLVLCILSLSAFAVKHTTPAKAYFMANAYTAIADDAYAIFYNPALLARNKGLSFHPLNVTVVAPNVLKYADEFDNLGDDPDDIYNNLSGIPFNIGYNFGPGLKLGNFGLSAIVENDTKIRFVNNVSPTLDIEYRDDRGFVTGYAFSIGKNVNFGFALKYINRKSIDQNLSLTSTTIMDAMNGADGADILDNLGKVESQGWSADFGVDYINKTSLSTFSFGFVFKDVYNNMKAEENADGLDPIEQSMSVNVATAYKIDLAGLLGLTLSGEIKDAQNTDTSLMSKFHFGSELSLTPAFSLMVGYHNKAISYGTRLNLFLLDLYVGLTEESIGQRVDQGKASGIVLYLSLFDFKFEP